MPARCTRRASAAPGSGGVAGGFVALGGGAANGGDGGPVSVANSGVILAGAPAAPGRAPTVSIPICGDGCSPGIFAQSIGGGGGHGGGSGAGGLVLSVAVGGKGGDGGPVTVEIDGALRTLGKESSAVHAQSVGGGHGGFAVSVALRPNTSSLSVAVGGSGGVAGKGFAQSITDGGGNGNFTFAGGLSGKAKLQMPFRGGSRASLASVRARGGQLAYHSHRRPSSASCCRYSRVNDATAARYCWPPSFGFAAAINGKGRDLGTSR